MKLAEKHGPVLTGRSAASKLVSDLVDVARREGHADLDFEGIKAVSPSFADELFGKLAHRPESTSISFTNLSDHLRVVAEMAERHRR